MSAPPPGRVGAFLSTSALGASDFNGALANWLALTGIAVPVTRWYQAQGDFSIGATNLTQMVAAGIRIDLTLRPDFNPTSAAHRTAIDTMLSTLKAAGADVNVTLSHEPFFSGLTAPQYVAMVNFYGPTVRTYYPLWFVCSGADAILANGYYPGDAAVDGVAVDAYAASGTTQITNAQSIADAGGKPFGVWEYNGGADLGSPTALPNGQTQAAVTTHFQFIQDLFVSRRAAGKPNGDLLLFSSGGTNGSQNFLTTALSPNGGFEGSLGNWGNGSGTGALSAVQSHSGAQSDQVTAPGGGGTSNIIMCSTPNVLTQALTCAPGDVVAGSGWFRAAATGRACQVNLHFYDASGVSISTFAGPTASDITTDWVNAQSSTTAPALTARCRLEPSIAATAASEVHFFDDPQISVIPATNDLTSPIQYPWDYRIGLQSAMKTALDSAAVVASGAGRGVAPLSRVGVQAGLLTLGAPLSPFDPPPGQGIQRYSFMFQLIDGVSGLNKGLVFPVQDSIPQLTHDVTRSIKRQVSLQLNVADATRVDIIRDRILIFMAMADGTSYPLGRYLFTDDTAIVSTGGNQGTAVLMDEEFIMDQQREAGFPPTSLTQRRADSAQLALGTVVAAIAVDIDQLTSRLMGDFPTIDSLFDATNFTSTSSWSFGTTSLQILTDLATQGDYFPPWQNNDGILRMVRSFEPSLAVPTVDWDRFSHVYADTITRTSDILAAPNRFVVVSNSAADLIDTSGATQTSTPVVGTYDVPVNAPHSIQNRGFVVPQVQQLQLPAGAAGQAAAVARNIGIQSTVFERTTLTTFPDPRHDSYDVVRWQGVNWLELAWSMDLIAGGNMSHTLRKTYAP